MQNEFENKVQELMAGFSIHPSASVWMEVENNIRKEKRNKRLFILWWTAAILMVAGVGVTWYVFNNVKVKTFANLQAKVENKANSVNRKTSLHEERSKTIETHHNNNQSNKGVHHNIITNRKHLKKQVQTLEEKELVSSKQNINTPQILIANKHLEKPNYSTSKKEHHNNENSTAQASKLAQEQSERILTGTHQHNHLINQNRRKAIDIKRDIATEQPTINKNVENNLLVTKDAFSLPEEIKKTGEENLKRDTAGSIVSIAQEKSQPKKDNILFDPIMKKKRKSKPFNTKWRVGIYASAGIADNVRKIVGQNRVINDAAYLSTSNSTGNSTAIPVVQLNNTKGFAGAIGVFVSRPISQKLGISTGFNFQYYSTKTTAGNKVNSGRNVYDTLTGNTSLVNDYFVPFDRSQAAFSQNTSTYTNNYYFLQMPVELSYSVLRKKPQAILFSLGLTPGVLLGSDALYYNRLDRISYVDRQQFKKFQFSAQAGISMQLINANKYRLHAGPLFMAGLTNMSKPVYNSSQHLLYLGIGTKLTFK